MPVKYSLIQSPVLQLHFPSARNWDHFPSKKVQLRVIETDCLIKELKADVATWYQEWELLSTSSLSPAMLLISIHIMNELHKRKTGAVMIQTFSLCGCSSLFSSWYCRLRRIYILYLHSDMPYHYQLGKCKVIVLIHSVHFSSNVAIEVARLSSCLQEILVTFGWLLSH